MPNIYLKEDGQWKIPSQLYIKDTNGVWSPGNQVYVKKDGVWTKCHENDQSEYLLIIGDGTNIFRNTNSYMALKPTSDDSYIIAGIRYLDATVTQAIYVAKLSSIGKIIWQRSFDGGDTDDQPNRIENITLDSNDNIYIVGSINRSGGYNNSALMIKLNSSGVSQWQQRWNYPNDSNGADYAYDALVNDNDELIMSGRSDYPQPYPPGGITRGSTYTFSQSDGTRSTNYAYNGGPSGLASSAILNMVRAGDHFYLQMSGGVTFTPNVGQRGYSAIVKTGLAADSMVAIKNTYIGSNSNLWRFRGVKTNGTNLLASAQQSSSNNQTFFVLNTSLSYVAGWTIANSTSGATTDFEKTQSYAYDGDYCYLAIQSTEEITHFVKFDVTDGTIQWQNKMVGDASNKTSDGNPAGVLHYDSSSQHLVFMTKSDETTAGSASSVLIMWRVKADGSGLGQYGNYTYSAASEISISSQGDTGGSNANVSFSSATPTDYGSPDLNVSDVLFTSDRTNFRSS